MGPFDLLAVNKMHLKLLALLVVVFSSALAENLSVFEKYQKDFGKEYSSPKEYIQRKAIFESNLKDIQNHNANRDSNTYIKGVNKFTDMTQQEFEAFTQGFPSVPKNIKKNSAISERSLKALRAKYANYKFEDTFSWVDQGVVTSVKDQGQCGSCTAFAVTGAVESCFAIKSGEVFDDLAEQFLVDCAYGYSDDDGFDAQGCAGAWPQAYLAYLEKETSGQHQMESAYPYTARDGTCSASDAGYYTGETMKSSISYWGTNEDDLKAMLVEHGPVVTGMDASHLSSYHGGIFHHWRCCNAASSSSCVDDNNHAVLVVGYGPGYWLVKNSWGKRWGEDGFFKIKSGTGVCGFGWQLNSVPLC